MKIILIMGLPGSGKTTLANEIAPLLNAKRLNADEVRKEQNELERNSAFEIRQKDLVTEVKILNLDKESEYARLEKQR
ncbi:AAA family ATPase, partial [Candidatus Pelagibacter sp.]|nr:AAA family ATPase [Candidatus Pelagibacter sp.]